MATSSPCRAPNDDQLALDAFLGHALLQPLDILVVVEVGLQHPPLDAAALHAPPAAASRLTVNRGRPGRSTT